MSRLDRAYHARTYRIASPCLTSSYQVKTSLNSPNHNLSQRAILHRPASPLQNWPPRSISLQTKTKRNLSRFLHLNRTKPAVTSRNMPKHNTQNCHILTHISSSNHFTSVLSITHHNCHTLPSRQPTTPCHAMIFVVPRSVG